MHSFHKVIGWIYFHLKNTKDIKDEGKLENLNGHISSVLIIMKTFSIKSLNSSLEILLSPF